MTSVPSAETAMPLADALARRELELQRLQIIINNRLEGRAPQRIPGRIQERVIHAQVALILPTVQDPESTPFSATASVMAMENDLQWHNDFGRGERERSDPRFETAYANTVHRLYTETGIEEYRARQFASLLGIVHDLAAAEDTEPSTIVNTNDTYKQAMKESTSPIEEAKLFIALGAATAELVAVWLFHGNPASSRGMRRRQEAETHRGQEALRQHGIHRIVTLWGLEGLESLPPEQYDALQNQRPLVPEVNRHMTASS